MEQSRRVISRWGFAFGLGLFSLLGGKLGGVEEGAVEEKGKGNEVFTSGVTVIAEYISLSTADFLRLTDDLPKDHGPKLRAALGKMIGEGKAAVEETALIQAKDTMSGKVESALEYIYPVEFEEDVGPVEMPDEAIENLDLLKPEGEAVLANMWGVAVPTVFDVRDVGTTLEMKADVAGDGSMTGIDYVAEVVQLAGRIPQGRFAGQTFGLEMPNFFSRRAATSNHFVHGESHFVAVHSPPGEDGKLDRTRKVMLFMRMLRHPGRKVEVAPPVVDPLVDPFALGAEREEPEERKPPVPEDPAGITVTVEFIKLPHVEVTRMLSEYAPKPENDATQLRKRVQGLIDEGTGEVIELSLLRAREGTKVNAGSTHEFLFPVEYDPPWVETEAEKKAREKVQLKKGADARKAPRWRDFRAGASAFDERKTGTAVEVEAFARGDGKSVDVVLGAELVRLIGMEHQGPGGRYASGIEQPRFYRQSVKSIVEVLSGGRVLLAVMTPPDEEGEADREHRVLVFVGATVDEGGGKDGKGD